jgi:DNA mismatch repair protein MutS
MSASKNTPMMQQYLSIKEKYPDAILFYRMGDFYEMFLDDAVVAARVLEITLTSRNKNDTAPVPMCGVPYRAARAYIARLIENGYKVAVCDQVEEAAQAKGLVRREVVQVITPGMIVDTDMLDAGDHNYLLALAVQRETMGLAYIDITTGLFRVVETGSAEKIVDEIQRIGPREVLLCDTLQSEPMFARCPGSGEMGAQLAPGNAL